jgi:hypothetical protein
MSGGPPKAGAAENISALQKKISGMLYLRERNNFDDYFDDLYEPEALKNYSTFTTKFGFRSWHKKIKPETTYSDDDKIYNAIVDYFVEELANPSKNPDAVPVEHLEEDLKDLNIPSKNKLGETNTDEVKTIKLIKQIIKDCRDIKEWRLKTNDSFLVNVVKELLDRVKNNMKFLKGFYLLACMPPNSFTINREDIKQALANIKDRTQLNDNEPIIIDTTLNEYIDVLNKSLKEVGVLEMNGKITDPLNDADKKHNTDRASGSYNDTKKAITKGTLSKIGDSISNTIGSIFGSKKTPAPAAPAPEAPAPAAPALAPAPPSITAGKRKLSSKKRKANKRKFKARKSRKH